MSARRLRNFDVAGVFPIRVLVAEASLPWQWSMCALLQGYMDISVIGTAKSGGEVLSQTGVLRPDLVVMNFEMPDMHGADVALRLRRKCPATRVLLIADEVELDPVVVQAGWLYGADSIMNKERVQEDLIPQIQLMFFKPEAA